MYRGAVIPIHKQVIRLNNFGLISQRKFFTIGIITEIQFQSLNLCYVTSTGATLLRGTRLPFEIHEKKEIDVITT
jgi:hypothetical protein